MSIFHLDENGAPSSISSIFSDVYSYNKSRGVVLGSWRGRTDDWRMSNLILDSNDLQELVANDSQRKRATSDVLSASNTSVGDQPPAPKVRRTDG